jgi:hypothetical protein
MPRMGQWRWHLRRVALVAALAPAACLGTGAGVARAGSEGGTAASSGVAAAQAARPPVRLTVVFVRGNGPRHVAHLRCSATRSTADGFLRSAGAARACTRARRAASLLTTPPARRACTQIYGGPERATVTGTIGGRRVARRFSRTNGCQIADWTAAGALLPHPRAAP